MAHLVTHDLAESIVPVTHAPASPLENTGRVFFGPTRSLHNTVQSQESKNNELSHVSLDRAFGIGRVLSFRRCLYVSGPLRHAEQASPGTANTGVNPSDFP